MRASTLLQTGLVLGTLSTLAACGDDTGGTGGSSSTTTSTTTTTTTSTTTTTTSGTGGAGGEGGAGTGGSAAGGNGTGGEGGGGTGTPSDHLLISEIARLDTAREFVEIYNPTNAAIDLSDVYITDNATYHSIATSGTWNPVLATANTDFAARFPAGTMIAAGGVLVIGFDTGFEAAFSDCPDFYMGTAPLSCNGGMIPVMLPAVTGSISDSSNISDSREMIMLFTWNGTVGQPLKDLDYVTWGTEFDDETRVSKTGVTGYVADTARNMQQAAPLHDFGGSIERCQFETGEDLTGGNGFTGHDETSENLASSFVVTATPSPGTKNSCLP
jgi:hypothetical protein